MNRTTREIGDELYGLAPQAFTAARNTYIDAAKNVGNRSLARELATWKRPSVAAGLVNLVALRRPDSVRGLIDLGQEIREAQGAVANVTAIQLRDLSARRRKELDTIVALAQTLAAERGDATPSRAALTEVESTFAAAMADDAAAHLVRAGTGHQGLVLQRLRPVVQRSRPVLRRLWPARARRLGGRVRCTGSARHRDQGPSPAGPKPAEADPMAAEKADSEAATRAAGEVAQRHAAAEDRASTARRRLADSTTAEAAAEGQVRQLADRMTELSQRLDVAQRAARAARQARLTAERDLASAERILRRYG